MTEEKVDFWLKMKDLPGYWDFIILPCKGVTKVSIPKGDFTPVDFPPAGNVNSGYVSPQGGKLEILERKDK